MQILRPSRHTPVENIASALLGLLIAIPLILATPTDQTQSHDVSAGQARTILAKPITDYVETVEPQVTSAADENPTEANPTDTDSESTVAVEIQPTAAQPILTQQELDLLARCVESEAGNQGLTGKRLVASVILNRKDDDAFPDTITDVILQHSSINGVWQFEVAGNGMLDAAEPTEETYEAIELELACRSNYDILYFSSTGFPVYGTPWKQVGDHYFNTGT